MCLLPTVNLPLKCIVERSGDTAVCLKKDAGLLPVTSRIMLPPLPSVNVTVEVIIEIRVFTGASISYIACETDGPEFRSTISPVGERVPSVEMVMLPPELP